MKISGWYKWTYSSNGKKGHIIRRYRKLNGKIVWETYPKKNYGTFSKDEIEALLRRLNASRENDERAALERYNFDHAYVNKSVIHSFEKFLETKANNKEYIRKIISMLNDYPFDFFINKQKISDPNLWKKKEDLFCHYLLEQKISPDHLQRIVQLTNRFISFLHNKFPDEIRLAKLNSVSNAVLKKRKELTKNTRTKYITDKDFKIICEKVDTCILNHIKLAYYFGLRRSEVLGLNVDDVYEDALNVERQLTKISPVKQYDLLKTFETRQVPHWNTTPDDAYWLIKDMNIIHPDTLGHTFKSEMIRLNLPFLFHDLRRTFITNALRKHHYRDVQLAAGHSQIKTTELYAQDDRQLQRKKFKPKLNVVR